MTTAGIPGPGQEIESNPLLHCGLQYWVKLQRKIIIYLLTWDVGNVVLLHPHISGIFLGNVHLHELIQFPNYSQFHALYLSSILLMYGGSLHTLYFSGAPIDKNLKPSHIRRTESKYQAWNWLYFGNLINPCKCTFPKRCQKCVDEGG